jgi:urease accessory protein UreF
MTLPTIPEVAKEAAPVLLPYLPYLLKGIKKAGELATAASQKLGEVQWDVVLKVWDRLRPTVEKQPEVKERLEEVAENKEDPDAETMLAWELRKVLAELPEKEVQEVHNLIQQTRSETRTVTASGERSVAIGGDASNATISTGDHYTEVEKPEKKD